MFFAIFQVNKCSGSNWQNWNAIDYKTWSIWSSGYTLSKNGWVISNTIKINNSLKN